jgi:glycosyltransferase involved in cell wall biosynthesis
MSKIDYEIIIPIYNEGKNILKVLSLFDRFIKYKIRVLLCYDLENDNIFKYKKKLSKFKFKIILIKNNQIGPCSAVKKGFENIKAKCAIVYPADDFINVKILDKMYKLYLNGADIVVASRFINGGSMKNCPLLKSIIVRLASSTLFFLSSIPVRDASNGFRLFSKKILNLIKIESRVGFAYSLELLVKCDRLKMKILEIPSQWEERSEGQSRFKVFKWLPQYFKWYIYGLTTTWLGKKKI